MSGLVLSLFPGIGLLDMAFEEEGFCVVRGPDQLWGGDIHKFHPPMGRFDGVIGGPPCQAFSSLRNLSVAKGRQLAANLIPEFERVVDEAFPLWFLMENVPKAPTPSVRRFIVHDQLLNNRWVGGTQNRLRRFSFGTRTGAAWSSMKLQVQQEALDPFEYSAAALASGGTKSPKIRARHARQLGYRTKSYLAEATKAQGLPAGFLSRAPFTSCRQGSSRRERRAAPARTGHRSGGSKGCVDMSAPTVTRDQWGDLATMAKRAPAPKCADCGKPWNGPPGEHGHHLGPGGVRLNCVGREIRRDA